MTDDHIGPAGEADPQPAPGGKLEPEHPGGAALASASLPSGDRASEIELRQDELLRLLDELNERLERALAEFSPRPARQARAA